MTSSTTPATKGVTEAAAAILDILNTEALVFPLDAKAKRLAERLALAALASLSLPASGEGGAPTWREFDHETIAYVLRYGGRCRECADHHGLCPNGLPCDVDDAKTAIRWVLKALNYGIGNGFLPSPALSQPQPDEMQPDTYTAGDFNGVVRGKRS